MMRLGIFLCCLWSIQTWAQQWDMSRPAHPLEDTVVRGFLRSDTTTQIFFPKISAWDRAKDKKVFWILPQYNVLGGVQSVDSMHRVQASGQGLFQLNAGGTYKRWHAEAGSYYLGGRPPLEKWTSETTARWGWGKFLSNKNDIIQQWDYTARLGFQANKYVHLEVGKGKLFVGEGYRSQFLSHNSSTYPYGRISIKVGPFRFVSNYAQLRSGIPGMGNQEKKYVGLHALSMDVKKKWNFALYEMVIWQRNDSTSVRNFDLHYLNPLAFWRPIEYAQGSADNVLLGLSASYTEKQRCKIYGQFLLDEWLLSEVRARLGWWGLKYGGQLGIQYFNVVPGLHMLLEANATRPFTYSHASPIQAWGHDQQALAHPLGSNYGELLYMVQYRHSEWRLNYQINYSRKGNNRAGFNDGGDIFASYMNPSHIYGNQLYQGQSQTLVFQQLIVARKMGEQPLEAFLQCASYNKTNDALGHRWGVYLGIRSEGFFTQAFDF
ncbi:MAG: hypothetical protein FJX95_01875 [Bacteroidetes bacterium]|nr:hypothetical protein [Bacteroidota bacterium]